VNLLEGFGFMLKGERKKDKLVYTACPFTFSNAIIQRMLFKIKKYSRKLPGGSAAVWLVGLKKI